MEYRSVGCLPDVVSGSDGMFAFFGKKTTEVMLFPSRFITWWGAWCHCVPWLVTWFLDSWLRWCLSAKLLLASADILFLLKHPPTDFSIHSPVWPPAAVPVLSASWCLVFPSFIPHLSIWIVLSGRTALLHHLFIYSFMLVWAHAYVFYSMGHNPVLR